MNLKKKNWKINGDKLLIVVYAFQKSFGGAVAEVNRKFSKIIFPFSEENHSKNMWDFQSIEKRSDAIRIRVTVSHTVDY